MDELTGPFPREIGNLASLNLLWISGNEITGTLPDIFDNLSNLTELEVSNNKLSGNFPESLWAKHFQNTSLQLRNNRFEGKIPDSVCDNDLVHVDTESWFLDKPRIKCECCGKAHCHMWNMNSLNLREFRPGESSKQRKPPKEPK